MDEHLKNREREYEENKDQNQSQSENIDIDMTLDGDQNVATNPQNLLQSNPNEDFTYEQNSYQEDHKDSPFVPNHLQKMSTQ